MSNEIDWSKAPEGATHFCPAVTGYCAHWIKPGYYQLVGVGSWFEDSSKTPDKFLIERPSTWNGDGLPPAGTVCEVLWNESRKEYLRTKVFGVNEHGQPIHRFDEGPKKFEYQADVLVTALGTKVFRPIRSAEQIAAKEREAAIAEMTVLSPLLDKGWSRRVCEAVYDAGYRKPSAK